MLDDSARAAAQAAAPPGGGGGPNVQAPVFLRVGGGRFVVLGAGARRVAARRLELKPATAEQARAATGFAIGGIPPLGHDSELETLIDPSLQRFATVWCAAGTPHAVFEIDTATLI